MKRGGPSGDVLMPSYMVRLNTIDLGYLLTLVCKDIKYIKGRMKSRAFSPRSGHTNADSTKVKYRAELRAKLSKLLEEGE